MKYVEEPGKSYGNTAFRGITLTQYGSGIRLGTDTRTRAQERPNGFRWMDRRLCCAKRN
jgi:hypothetical protein